MVRILINEQESNKLSAHESETRVQNVIVHPQETQRHDTPDYWSFLVKEMQN